MTLSSWFYYVLTSQLKVFHHEYQWILMTWRGKLGKQAKCFCQYFDKSVVLKSTPVLSASCCWPRSYMLHSIGFMKDTAVLGLRIRVPLEIQLKIKKWIHLLTSLKYIFKDWAKYKVPKIPLKQKLGISSLKELIHSDCETKHFCKSSSVLTIWLQVKLVEDRTTQSSWCTFDDMCQNQTGKSGTQKIFCHASGSQLPPPN